MASASVLRRFPALVLACLIAGVGVAGCMASAPTPRPDPSAACGGADQQRSAGFYPDLEARLPASLSGASPSSRDSGRYCSAKTLGPLRADGHDEVRFAGETFPATSQSGVSLVVYSAAGLTADQVGDAFRAGAGTGRSVEVVSDAPHVVAGRSGRRLEVINGDARQVVVVWPAVEAGLVRIVIAADLGNAAIDQAVAALEAQG
jgi:hypothetical protein